MTHIVSCWVMVARNLVGGYQYIRRTYCSHLHGRLHGAIIQKTTIQLLNPVEIQILYRYMTLKTQALRKLLYLRIQCHIVQQLDTNVLGELLPPSSEKKSIIPYGIKFCNTIILTVTTMRILSLTSSEKLLYELLISPPCFNHVPQWLQLS
jgi:hypothetical protein